MAMKKLIPFCLLYLLVTGSDASGLFGNTPTPTLAEQKRARQGPEAKAGTKSSATASRTKSPGTNYIALIL